MARVKPRESRRAIDRRMGRPGSVRPGQSIGELRHVLLAKLRRRQRLLDLDHGTSRLDVDPLATPGLSLQRNVLKVAATEIKRGIEQKLPRSPRSAGWNRPLWRDKLVSMNLPARRVLGPIVSSAAGLGIAVLLVVVTGLALWVATLIAGLLTYVGTAVRTGRWL
jgi:hypothetical protein